MIERSEWFSEEGFVYRLIWDGDSHMVNEYSFLIQRGHETTKDDCASLAKRVAALLNAADP